MSVSKAIIYGIVVFCFLLAGVLDLSDREWKMGVLAIGFGVLNFMIFFWR